MDINREEKKEEMNCNLLLEDRKKLQITGVIEVIRFNEEEILLNTKLGTLLIKGENLKMYEDLSHIPRSLSHSTSNLLIIIFNYLS